MDLLSRSMALLHSINILRSLRFFLLFSGAQNLKVQNKKKKKSRALKKSFRLLPLLKNTQKDVTGFIFFLYLFLCSGENAIAIFDCIIEEAGFFSTIWYQL